MNQVQRAFTGSPIVPDAIEPIRGMRVFGLDNRGRLTAARFPHYYRPGENVAKCLRNHPYASYISGAVSSLDKHPQNKKAPAATCTCGFYGFWDVDAYLGDEWNDAVEWGHATKVQGVIEGYGLVLLGTWGFRAEKCRVVAINAYNSGSNPRVRRCQELYPDVAFFENKTERRVRRTRYVNGSGREAMLQEFPLYTPRDEGDTMWEWDRIRT